MATEGNEGKKGGARPGAGRPVGSTTLVSRRKADQYARDGGVLPVDVMMGTMRALWADATLRPAVEGKKEREPLPAGEFDRALMRQAHEVAKDVAPYLHPKLASMEVGGPNGGPIETLVRRAEQSLQGLSQEEFDTLMALMSKLGMVNVSAPGAPE